MSTEDLDRAATDGWDVDLARPPQTVKEISPRDRARAAMLEANTKLRTAELARASASHRHQDLDAHHIAVNAASEAYNKAREAYEKFEPRDDPFRGIPQPE